MAEVRFLFLSAISNVMKTAGFNRSAIVTISHRHTGCKGNSAVNVRRFGFATTSGSGREASAGATPALAAAPLRCGSLRSPSLRSAPAKPPGDRTTPREFPFISSFFFLALLITPKSCVRQILEEKETAVEWINVREFSRQDGARISSGALAGWLDRVSRSHLINASGG